jgi:hypothetical protein
MAVGLHGVAAASRRQRTVSANGGRHAVGVALAGAGAVAGGRALAVGADQRRPYFSV